MSALPVRSPLSSYVLRGDFAFPLGHPPQPSRDLSRRTSRRPRRVSLVLVLLLPALATGCAAIREETWPQYFVLTLPASIGVFAFATAVLVLLALLGGFALGVRHAGNVLRAADSATAQYHRAEVAAILDASSTVHHLVQDIVAQTHWRIDDLREQLKHLKETQP